MPLYDMFVNPGQQSFETLRSFSQADQPISCPSCGKMDANGSFHW